MPAITVTIDAPAGDLVFTELHLPATSAAVYPVVKPGGYTWETGKSSEEGLALQSSATVSMVDTGNTITTLLMETHPYLRGRTVTVLEGAATHTWELDAIAANGKTVELSLISPVASALVQAVPSDPVRLSLDADANDSQDVFSFAPFAAGGLGTPYHGITDTHYFVIDDEVVGLSASNAARLYAFRPGVATSQAGFSRGLFGTERSEHDRLAVLTQMPLIRAQVGTAIQSLFDSVGKADLVPASLITRLDAFGVELHLPFYEETTIGDALAQMAVLTGMFLYWDVDSQTMNATLPGTATPVINQLDTYNVVDTPLPVVSQDSRQYTRAQIRAQKRDLSETEYSQIATSVDADAEDEAQYDRQLLYQEELSLFDGSTANSQAVLTAIDAATQRIVRRYRDPRQQISLDTEPSITMGTLFQVQHPSVPSSDRLYQVTSISDSADRYHRTVKGTSIRDGSGLISGGFNNRVLTLTYGAAVMDLDLASELRKQASILDPADLTGTLTVNFTGPDDRVTIGGTTLTRGALHITGFANVTSLTINLPLRGIIYGRAGLLDIDNLFLRDAGDAVTLGSNRFSTVNFGARIGNVRAGTGAGGGFSPFNAEATGAVAGRGSGWTSTGFVRETAGTSGSFPPVQNNPTVTLTAGNGGTDSLESTAATITGVTGAVFTAVRDGQGDFGSGLYPRIAYYRRGRRGQQVRQL